jgi:hypothetical protein
LSSSEDLDPADDGEEGAALGLGLGMSAALALEDRETPPGLRQQYETMVVLRPNMSEEVIQSDLLAALQFVVCLPQILACLCTADARRHVRGDVQPWSHPAGR